MDHKTKETDTSSKKHKKISRRSSRTRNLLYKRRCPSDSDHYRKLSSKENLWLKSLTNGLNKTDSAKKLIEDYRNHTDNSLYKSVMETIMRANQKTFKEVNGMSDIFMEIVQEKFDRKLKEETEKAVEKAVEEAVEKTQREMKINAMRTRLTERISLIQKKCAKNKSLPVIAEELETEVDELRSIYNVVSENPEKTVDEIYELVFG